MNKLSKPVNLKVFVDRKEQPEKSDYTMSILREYEEHSHGFLTIEIFQFGENIDLDKKLNIQRVPTILFIDEKGNELIRYLSAPQGSEIEPFIQALLIFAGATNYYQRAIRENLNKIIPSTIKVIVTNSCAYCPQIVSLVSQFALASEGKISAVIIDITENPDIGKKYNASSFPFTVINEKKHLVGMYGADEIINELIEPK
jgi:thioredoxin reductase (NADPH)